MDNNFNNLSLIQLIIKWKWHIITITVAAALCGGIFSSAAFITPLYKSEAIAYPANIDPYSDESETEQMLQLINSQAIVDSIVERFDLWSDYNIDRNYKYAKTYLLNEYHSKIKISKTPYSAISISVADKDPEVACNIAKDILHLYDKRVQAIHKMKNKEVVEMYQRQLLQKQESIDSLKNRMRQLSEEYGVLEYESQSREVTKSYLNGNSAKSTELMKNVGAYGPEMIDLAAKIEAEANSYTDIKADYEQELRFLMSEFTYSNIVSEPFPADKKFYPVRWVVVALCGIGAFLLSILAIFVIENRKRFIAENK